MDPLLNTILRHQIYLEGLKKGKNAEFFGTIGRLNVALRRELSVIQFDDLGEMSKTQLAKLLAALKKTAKSIFDAYLSDLIRWLEEYMHVDWEFFNFAFPLSEGFIAEDDEETEDESDAVWGFILNLPMGANGLLLKTFLSAVGIMGTNKIADTVRQHWVNNSKKQELIDALLGTKGAGYGDGLLATLARQGNAASDTVIQHIGANTSAKVASKYWDEYQWISVLDNGTTDICRSRAWLKYRYGFGPIPPAHVRCRSSTIPVTSRGPLADMLDFKVWADAQSEQFKADAFDGKVRSRYDGSKALTLEEFKSKRSLILS